jgi:RIB43A
LDRFRIVNQKPEYCREFDIWDPQKISKEVPCRISDDDPRCGPSSAQKYEYLQYFLSCQNKIKKIC